MEIKAVIKGQPITKKNSQAIIVNKRTGLPMVIASKQFREYFKLARPQLYHLGNLLIKGDVHLKVHYWLINKRRPDLINLIQATADIIEACGLIANDQQIVSLDGSRIMGVSKDRPRAEIYINELD